jgi:hypothetical protein
LILTGAGAHGSLTLIRTLTLVMAVAAVTVVSLIRNRSATHAVLLQAAHRAIALAIWALIAKLILTAWGRPLTWVGHLLPATFGLLAIAALSALGVLYTSRDQPDPADFTESRHLTKVAAVLLAVTLAWMLFAAAFTSR